MNAGHSNDDSELDRIRIHEGADKCKAAFAEILKKDPRHAQALINDDKLAFPCLYILREQAKGLRMHGNLSPRAMFALRFADQLSAPKASATDDRPLGRDSAYSALKWIWETGSGEEIVEDDYERILDVSASVLINTYGDVEILPMVADLIFKRNRNGRHLHDLVWTLFEVHDPRVLKLVAGRLRSSEPKDARLAGELLNIDETGVPADEGGGEKRLARYLTWLEENEPYLYFTRESFQYAGKPAFCALDLERKYLQKGVPSYDQQPIFAVDADANERLSAFGRLSAEEQKVLSAYSQQIHGKSDAAWREWLQAPMGEQIRAAKAGWEGEV